MTFMTITQPPGRPVTISRDLGPMGEYNSIFKNRLSEVGVIFATHWTRSIGSSLYQRRRNVVVSEIPLLLSRAPQSAVIIGS